MHHRDSQSPIDCNLSLILHWLCDQASASAKDRSISQMTQKINQIERDLKKSQNQFADEKSRLISREAELLKAKADVSVVLNA